MDPKTRRGWKQLALQQSEALFRERAENARLRAAVERIGREMRNIANTRHTIYGPNDSNASAMLAWVRNLEEVFQAATSSPTLEELQAAARHVKQKPPTNHTCFDCGEPTATDLCYSCRMADRG